MKTLNFNILQKSILGFCLTLLIVGCSKDDDSSVKLMDDKVLVNLREFNDNFDYTGSTNNFEKKKWWQIIGQVAAVVGGDAAGAAAGVWASQGLAGVVGAATAGTGYVVVATIAGVVTGIGGSYAAYCSTGGSCRGAFNNSNPKGQSIKYEFSNQHDYLENFGLLHNDGLENIHLSNGTTEIKWIESNIPNVREINYKSLYYSEEFQDLKTRVNIINSNFREKEYDVEYLLSEYQKQGLININIKKVLSLYLKAIYKVENFDDLSKITEYYVETIDNSEIRNREKESLLSAFSVSIQSFYYWYNLEVK